MDMFGKAAAEQRRRERDAAVERGREERDGFSDVQGKLVERDGVPDSVIEFEIGAAWIGETPETHPDEN